MKGYGERIKKLRRSKKWTQDMLGDKLGGLSKSYISKIENESYTPSIELFNEIANILDVEFTQLFSEHDIPDQLMKEGVKWMALGEKLEKEGISIEQVEQWAEIVKKYTQNK